VAQAARWRDQWVEKHGCPWGESTCHNAAAGGHLEVLKWARERKCKWTAGTSAVAAGGGHMEVLQWLGEHGCPFDRNACMFAARAGGDIENMLSTDVESLLLLLLHVFVCAFTLKVSQAPMSARFLFSMTLLPERGAGGVEVATGARLPVGRVDV